MSQFINAKNGAILFGAILLIGSITSAFADPSARQAPASPIDRLEDGDAFEVVPTLVTPTTWVEPEPTPLPSLTPFQPPAQTFTPEVAGRAVEVEPTLARKRVYLTQVNSAEPPTSTPQPRLLIPDRLVIPAITLDAPVVPSSYRLVDHEGAMYQQWKAPDEFAAGWQSSSASLGVPGNTVLHGHNNIYGSVFAHLVDLAPGDTIKLYSGETVITYEITNHMILPEKAEPLSVRMENARWLQPSTDERLTLVTCWPEWTNTHRLVIVAKPVEE